MHFQVTYSTSLKAVAVLLLALSAFSLPARAAQVSQFCPDCTDDSVARQKATGFAPPVRCDWPNGSPQFPIPEDLVCHSSDLDVLLINPLTGQLFPYAIRFESQLNRHILQTRVMSADERQAALTTVEIYQELMVADFGGSASMSGTIQSTTPGIENSMECPNGTALDYVLNPELRQSLINELRDQWVFVLSRFNNRNARVSRTGGISVEFGSISVSAGWSSSPPPLDDVFISGFRFDFSEVAIDDIVNSDIITFVINEARLENLTFVLDAVFSRELSRAGGVAVNRLLSGLTIVDNPCVIEKLARYAESINAEFRTGGPGGDPFDLGGIDLNQGGQFCTRRLCATVCVNGDCQCQFKVVVLVPCN